MRRTLIPAFILVLCMAGDISAGTMPMSPRKPYDEIALSELFVVGTLQTAAPFASLRVWRVRVERVVKGPGNLSFVYVATSPQHNENPFGRQRKLGSRVFVGLEATRLSVPAAAKPEAEDPARAETEAGGKDIKCHRITTPFAGSEGKTDSYFRCAILYYEMCKDVRKLGLQQRKARLRELSKELEALTDHLKNEVGEKGE